MAEVPSGKESVPGVPSTDLEGNSDISSLFVLYLIFSKIVDIVRHVISPLGRPDTIHRDRVVQYI